LPAWRQGSSRFWFSENLYISSMIVTWDIFDFELFHEESICWRSFDLMLLFTIRQMIDNECKLHVVSHRHPDSKLFCFDKWSVTVCCVLCVVCSVLCAVSFYPSSKQCPFKIPKIF
jgi:hypothetical protein